jgi:hypothetical protein
MGWIRTAAPPHPGKHGNVTVSALMGEIADATAQFPR